MKDLFYMVIMNGQGFYFALDELDLAKQYANNYWPFKKAYIHPLHDHMIEYVDYDYETGAFGGE